MLIHLDRSAVLDVVSGSSATAERSHACIENLLLAHFDGNHVVSLLPDAVAALRATSWLRRARRALEHIDTKFAEIARFRKHVPWSLEPGVGPGFDGKAYEVAGTKVIRAPLHAFEKLHTASRATLLGENEFDARLFRELGLMMRAARGWEGAEMAHFPRGGGGDTTADEYQGMAEQGMILLAIADTDMRHPADRGGGTYGKLEAAARGRPDYQRVRPLPTRTAEGIVPLDVYEEIFGERPGDQRLGSVARLAQLLRSAPADILRYAHLKDGIRLHQVNYPKTETEGDYWSDIAKRAKRDQCTRSTLKGRVEHCDKREECECYVVDGLGGKALSEVVTWMEAQKSKKRLVARFGLSGDPELAALADEVLAWGLALSGLLT